MTGKEETEEIKEENVEAEPLIEEVAEEQPKEVTMEKQVDVSIEKLNYKIKLLTNALEIVAQEVKSVAGKFDVFSLKRLKELEEEEK